MFWYGAQVVEAETLRPSSAKISSEVYFLPRLLTNTVSAGAHGRVEGNAQLSVARLVFDPEALGRDSLARQSRVLAGLGEVKDLGERRSVHRAVVADVDVVKVAVDLRAGEGQNWKLSRRQMNAP